MKEYNEELSTGYPMVETAWTGRFLEALPYRLTGAQQRVWKEIQTDLVSGKCMNRLVQGDVGSGKTVVAAYAGWLCAKGGIRGL